MKGYLVSINLKTLILAAGLVHVCAIGTAQAALPGQTACSAAKISEILATASVAAPSVVVDCSLTLDAGKTITKQLLFNGAAASGATLNCNGATLRNKTCSAAEHASDPSNAICEGTDRILVQSIKTVLTDSNPANWTVPSSITIKSCKLQGGIRLIGMGSNGEAEEVYKSSRIDAQHTSRAQAVAPKSIVFDNLDFTLAGTKAIYFGPGVTKSVLKNSRLKGYTYNTTLYLDTESADNSITNNIFDAWSTTREVIAIDGSARNTINNNTFNRTPFGGIEIYRNCGENGTVRHQKPTDNKIVANTFLQTKSLSIYVGSRRAQANYCSYDKGLAFGSSNDDRDYALNTIINSNTFKLNNNNANFFNRFVIAISSDSSAIVSSNKIEVKTFANFTFANRVLYNTTIPDSFKDNGGNSVIMPTRHLFACMGADNNGCFKAAACPASKKIAFIRAACDLEDAQRSQTPQFHYDLLHVSSLPVNTIKVMKKSDITSDGICQVGAVTINELVAASSFPDGFSSVWVGCKEHDGSGGGDCVIAGELICVNQ